MGMKKKKGTETKERGFIDGVKPGQYRLVGGLAFIDKSDSRYKDYRKAMRKTGGVSPDETWNLDVCFGMFMAPRVRLYKELTIGYPGYLKGMDEWHKILDQIAEGLEMLGRGEPEIGDPDWKAKERKIKKALRLFAKYIQSMWC